MWAVLGADQGEQWPKPEQEGDLGRDLDRKVDLARVGVRPGQGSGPHTPPTDFSIEENI